MDFVVKRSAWVRGQGGLISALLTQEGKRCCLGFAGQQCGIADEYLLDIKTPASVQEDQHEKWPANFIDKIPDGASYTDWIGMAMHANDAKDSEVEREGKLQKLFIDNGHTITFVD